MKYFQILSLILLLCGCHNPTQTYTRQDSGKEITLNKGTSAVISLAENPTTGYSWEFFIVPNVQNVIGDIKEEYKQERTENGMVGVGGIKTYRFTAKHGGNVTIKGYYFRPWEDKNSHSADKVTYLITVL